MTHDFPPIAIDWDPRRGRVRPSAPRRLADALLILVEIVCIAMILPAAVILILCVAALSGRGA